MQTGLLIFIFLIIFGLYVVTYFGEYIFPGRIDKNIIKNCEACYELEGVKEISNKEQLADVMTEFRKQLAISTFRDITQPAHCPSGEFLEIPLSPPWPDYIEHYFRCNECQAELSADTFGVEKHSNIQGELEKY